MDALDAAQAIRNGAATSRALVEEALAKADAIGPLNAFITLDADGARAAADRADAAVKAGARLGALHGVPVVVKDNINSAGLPTTGGTPALKTFVPAENAPVLQALLDAGAILIGKTNLHELAYGITSNNAAFGPVGAPCAPDRFAGGSSGGTAAAITGGVAPIGLGTDTGGSVRIPAALTGIAGLRPTVGRYPGEGIVPISHTRDTAGPMAHCVADLVLLDSVLSGDDAPVEPLDPGTLRLGVAPQFTTDLDPETARVFEQATAKLQAAGATLVEVDAGALVELCGRVGFPLTLYETRTDLDAFVKRYGAAESIEAVAAAIASPDVKAIFETAILSADAVPEAAYEEVMKTLRPHLVDATARLYADNRLDALVFPTTPLPAQPIEGSDETVMLNGRAVPTFPTFIRNTDLGSVVGFPGLSIPAGATAEGLPVGIEFDAPAGADRRLLALGLAAEAILDT